MPVRGTLTLLALISAFLVLPACKSTDKDKPATMPATTEPASMGAVNDTCPMSGEPVDPDAPTADYAGHTIGFCCGGCVRGWERKTDAQKREYLAGQTN